MNRSGISVRKVVDYFKISVDHLLICYDDLDLPFAALRMRPSGSSGAQRIEVRRQPPQGCPYSRLRLGIGRDGRGEKAVVRYVLSDFTLRSNSGWNRSFCEQKNRCKHGQRLEEKAMSWFNDRVPEQGDK